LKRNHLRTDAIHDGIPGEINDLTSKATPVSADVVLIEDSAASYAKKKTTAGAIASAGGGSTMLLVYHLPEPLAEYQGPNGPRWPMTFAGTIVTARYMLDDAPTGSSSIVDIHLNGTTIFTTQANRPTIAIDEEDSGNSTPDVTSFSAGDYFQFFIDQIGSGNSGSDGIVTLEITKT
jgi:hypothetical protein